MINLRRAILILISSLTIVMCTACSKNSITVYNCNTEIKYGIESFIRKEYPTRLDIELINSRYIDNIQIVSFCTTSQDFGYAILEKEDKTMFKIRSVFLCTNAVNNTNFKTHKGKYSLNISKYEIDFKFIGTFSQFQKPFCKKPNGFIQKSLHAF